jgi:membrane protease YdiL (CAAX protease family)
MVGSTCGFDFSVQNRKRKNHNPLTTLSNNFMQTGFAIIQFVILTMCLALWAHRLIAKRRLGEVMHLRQHDVSPVGIIDIFATVVAWFALQVVGAIIIPLAMGTSVMEVPNFDAAQLLEFSGWAMLLQLAATIAAMGFILIRHRRVTWYGQARSLGHDILVGGATSLMLIPIVMLIQLAVTQLIPYTHPTLDSLKENFTGSTVVWAWIAAVGVAPLTEEFFFRGLLQGWLQRTFDHDESKEVWFIGGPVTPETSRETPDEVPFQKFYRFWAPIFISSVLFAAVHAGQGPAPVPLFVLALGLGYVFRKTGSLVPCVIVHVVLNALSLTVLSLGIMYPELMPPEAEPAPGAIWFW